MRRIGFILAGLLFATTIVTSQELVFFEGQLRVYERVDGELFELQDSLDGVVDFGYRLDTNYVVRTFDGFAEILLPNGHILKLAENTEVRLDEVVPRGSASGTDRVAVTGGRLRSVVSGLTGTGREFQVRTPTAVGGVRGTDFVAQVGATSEIIAVLEGVVEFTNQDGALLALSSNQFADAIAENFVPTQANVAERFYGSLLELSDQIRAAREEILAEITEDQIEPEPEEAEPEEAAEPVAPAPDEVVTVTPPAPTAEPDPGIEPGEGPVDQFMASLAETLGLEIGTISLEGVTYSKLIVQPTFQIGRLRAGLYLPVIYSGNLFDMDDWYRPRGNNEWSFGTDQDWNEEPLVALSDLFADLALKIRFIEWGSMRDPFFFKVGNLSTLQLGHGLLMRNYANDTDFPAVRRIGFNLGIDFGRAGFEVIANDLANPEIFGTRLYARPFARLPLAVGVSGVTDIGPARELPAVDTDGNAVFDVERTADPLFLNVALDLDLPVIERDALALILFADAGGLLPYLRSPAGGLEAGMQTQALLHETANGTGLRNYGIAAGVLGNITVLDYRLEYQQTHGIFQPGFYGPNYDRIRGERVRETIAYLQNPDAPQYQNETVGIYGEAGFTIANLFRFQAGYRWPWTRDPDTNEIVIGTDDYLGATLGLRPGLLPLGISGAVTYERRYFAPTLTGRSGFENARLFDENTVLQGEIAYPVAPIMDVVATITTTPVRDSAGRIVYEERAGELRPRFGPVISIETRIGGARF